MIGKTNVAGENLTPELTNQAQLIQSIRESLAGKATLANATADKILEGYSAYVGQQLVTGSLKLPTIDGSPVSGMSLVSKVVDLNMGDLPTSFAGGSAVVLNGEIHILGGLSPYKSHYKWNGSTWTSVSTLPYSFQSGSAVVLNDEIHILGSSSSGCYTNHYKWNGSSWTQLGGGSVQLL